ncbi:DUF4198 domain-containing protein [Robiginitalea marina]|uniref:DUF4198 domain-containing protein n=1 Tax=Robiginitalea marina TaxID=2954105 RepID=A0ABT1AZX1_9FLAO|nr:DUF4198 domain-containing protein [Robiginitalea marina]MCO5725130.1 DUF4198 domain-containing protein [Robiginitalea marina]
MKNKILLLFALLLFCSHDMYLKPDNYFLEPDAQAAIELFNGTFEKSENVIARNRMADVSLVGNGRRIAVDSTQWSERDSITILRFKTGQAGTWVAGVSTFSRTIEMTAEDFNGYLEHDGVLDMLEWRRANNTLGQNAAEEYSKHVKTIFQVGDQTSDDWKTPLGYPIEFVPLQNPYDLHPGHSLEVQLLWQGKPLANQLVYAGPPTGVHSHEPGTGHSHEASSDHKHEHEADHTHGETGEHSHEQESDHTHGETGEHSHEQESDHTHGEEGMHSHQQESGHTHKTARAEEFPQGGSAEQGHSHPLVKSLRTDADGLIKVDLTAEGVWYLRTIYLTPSEKPGLTHESNWATLTFAIGEGHSHSHDGDTHSHGEDGGIPSYFYWIGSLVLLIVLFFWFKRKD